MTPSPTLIHHDDNLDVSKVKHCYSPTMTWWVIRRSTVTTLLMLVILEGPAQTSDLPVPLANISLLRRNPIPTAMAMHPNPTDIAITTGIATPMVIALYRMMKQMDCVDPLESEGNRVKIPVSLQHSKMMMRMKMAKNVLETLIMI